MSERVVIAGAGPVGLVAAAALLRAGAEVVVLEAGDDLAAESRASTFHPPTLEMLDELGVGDRMLTHGLIAPTFQHRTRSGEVIAELDLGVLAGDTRHPYRVQLEQSLLTRFLAEDLGGVIRFGSKVLGVEQSGELASAVLASGERVAGDWVIGADGASSAVRHSLGVNFEGHTYPERYLVVSTPVDFASLLPGLAYVNYIADPVEWLVLLRTPSIWRALFPVPEGLSDEDAVAPARIEVLLQGAVPRTEPYAVSHVSLYRVHLRVASSFRAGRVLLAGDAAHVNNPLGGMGMNSGIHDAVTLAASIMAGDGAVDAWAEARGKVARTIVGAQTQANYERLQQRDPALRARSDAELREIAADPQRARVFLRRSCLLDSARRGMPAVVGA